MSLRPTFYGFELGRSALAANQRNIDITGQNIANINTPGFSRQRVNLAAIGVGALETWRYALSPSDNVGLGVDMLGIQRVRDEFLDVRFWKDNSDLGRYSTRWGGLDALEMLLDEFTMPNLQEGLFRYQDALQELANNADNIEYAKQAMSIAETLTRTLNKTAVDIETIINDQLLRLELVVKNINHAAASIDRINKELRTQKVSTGVFANDENGDQIVIGGFMSNELLDERDLLLDELSSYGNIRIEKYTEGGWSVFFGVGDNDEVLLVDGTRGTGDNSISEPNVYLNYEGYFNLLTFDRESYMSIYDPTEPDSLDDFDTIDREPFRVTWATGDSAGDDVIVNSGQILGFYEILNGIGDVEELNSLETMDRAAKGIPYFLSMVNAFAINFAERMNDVNDDGSDFSDGGDLFESSEGMDINARTIKISDAWRNDPYLILRTDRENLEENPNYAADNSNILRMINELKREDAQIEYANSVFTGSFLQFAVSLNSEITIEVNYNNKQLAISDGLVLSLENLRDSIKSVNEDEEAMNLMKFSRSYNAAARFMTVLDEMVETIVNRLGIVGR